MMETQKQFDLFKEHEKIRLDFPILDSIINENKLVYLDNAATTHKPLQVIDQMSKFLKEANGTVRRGVYDLSVKSTQEFDSARAKVKNFINAKSTDEVIFTRGTTESINLVAFCLTEALKGNLSPEASSGGRKSKLKTDDDVEILITSMEHHANIVPWQINAQRLSLKTSFTPVQDNGELDLKELFKALERKEVRILAITHVSNALGTINPIKEIIQHAHKHNVIVVTDGAQGISHAEVDVQDLDTDFYVFSGHKLYGPTGVGVLYGKKDLLNEMPPYHGGGEMINIVKPESTSYAPLPFKFEAGTPAIADVIGLGYSIDYVNSIGIKQISQYENHLYQLALEQTSDIEGLKLIGQAQNKAAIFSFVFEDIEAFDIGTMLNQYGIAIRTGHHCTQPLMSRYNVSSTARASFAFYNNEADVDSFAQKLKKVVEIFR
jgi:cysteine desulfurase / selenocysteine lyase